jgi:hypothetical protein
MGHASMGSFGGMGRAGMGSPGMGMGRAGFVGSRAMAMSGPMGMSGMRSARWNGARWSGWNGGRWAGHNRHHHRFFRVGFGVGFFGYPYYDDYSYYDSCYQRIWTPYGWSWQYACSY